MHEDGAVGFHHKAVVFKRLGAEEPNEYDRIVAFPRFIAGGASSTSFQSMETFSAPLYVTSHVSRTPSPSTVLFRDEFIEHFGSASTNITSD